MTGRLVLLGVSTRALAESPSSRDGDVVAVDFFGDRDLDGVVETYAVGRDLGLPATASGLAEAARRLGAGTVVYGANLENHPDVLSSLALRSEVAGNGASAVRCVRDWRILRDVCREEGIAAAPTLLRGEEGRAVRPAEWLVKPVRSGGGHGVGVWGGEPLDDGHLLQRRLPGRPASVAFVADGRRGHVFAFTEQLIGREEFGASGFTWCGNLLPGSTSEARDALRVRVTELADALARRFELRGVNGADVVIGRDGEGRPAVHLIEVNPRFSASMELAQRAMGTDVLALHLQACAGRLPSVAPETASTDYHGKAVVFARQEVTVPCTDGWYELGRRDVPRTGARIGRGHPVCTVLAGAPTRPTCLALLRERADAVARELEPCRGREPALASGREGA